MRLGYATAVALVSFGSAAGAMTIDFESLSAGDIVTSLTFGGVTVGVDGFSNTQGAGAGNQAMVFDTENPTGGDSDLAAPFFDGTVTDFRPGNVLIISEDGDTSDADDDGKGGTITFTFSKAVNLLGFDVFDDVNMTILSGSTVLTSVVLGSDNEFSSQDVFFGGLTEVTFDFGSHSGAIDNIDFSVVPVPASLPLLLVGLGGLGWAARRRKTG